MSTGGQTINDRLNAAKYTIAGRSLSRCICKATTEELLQPKKKHLDYLAACTYETDISMMQLANQLIERANHSNWIVVYKSLITVHHLMSFGNERFIQYLASSNYTLKPDGFHDKVITKGYNMATYIRRYAIYINQKSLSYRGLAVDLCRKQRTKEKILRSMPIDRLLETLPVVHKQLGTLLNFDCSAHDLTCNIMVACFRLLFHDAIRLFASYNDGIINLFEKYFDLNKKMCREAFEAYKKFLDCADRVSDFLKVAEAINLDRGDIPDFKRAPSSLLQALEQHLISLETNKRDKSIVISASSATMPSFSADVDFEPSLSMVVKGYDATSQLAFGDQTCEQGIEAINALSNFDSDFNSTENFSKNSNPYAPATKDMVPSQGDSMFPPLSSPPRMTRNQQAAISPVPNLKVGNNMSRNNSANSQLSKINHNSDPFRPVTSDTKAIDELNASVFFDPPPQKDSNSLQYQQQQIELKLHQQQLQRTDISSGEQTTSNSALEFKPPGFCDGSLLEPEFSIQTRFDPSIDFHTQQQLIQIQREQAALKRRQNTNDNSPSGIYNNNNINNNNNNNIMDSNSHHNTNSSNNNSSYNKSGGNIGISKLKSKQESMFEDLEKSMRQSLKVDK